LQVFLNLCNRIRLVRWLASFKSWFFCHAFLYTWHESRYLQLVTFLFINYALKSLIWLLQGDKCIHPTKIQNAWSDHMYPHWDMFLLYWKCDIREYIIIRSYECIILKVGFIEFIILLTLMLGVGSWPYDGYIFLYHSSLEAWYIYVHIIPWMHMLWVI
jgi:hypothetical protein